MSTALVPVTLDEAKEMARLTSNSSLLPAALRGRVEDVFVTILAGNELGLAPMQAIRSMHIINGRPVLSAELMVALCKRRRDVCKYFQLVESTPLVATYETHREGDPAPTRMSYTMDEASLAGLLNNPTWKKHPAAMLRARASSSLARAVYPDLVLGILEEDEAREIRRELAAGVREEDVIEAQVEPVADVPRAAGIIRDNSFTAPREADFPMAAEAAPLVSFDAVHEAMNRIPSLFGDAKKRERQEAYHRCFGHVGPCGVRWNPGKEFHTLSPADRAKVLERVKELAEQLADDLPSNLGGTAPPTDATAGWGATGTGAPEPNPDAPDAEKETVR